jgi:hypothetical protein
MTVNLEQELPTSSVVPESGRLAFLPMLFGRHFMRGEALVYRWMDSLCEAYSGGYWEYLKLSNGSGYMAPKRDDKMKICVDSNYFEAEMSADAAGVVASMFALCQLANLTQDDGIIERYHALRAYAVQHAEAHLIMRAID